MGLRQYLNFGRKYEAAAVTVDISRLPGTNCLDFRERELHSREFPDIPGNVKTWEIRNPISNSGQAVHEIMKMTTRLLRPLSALLELQVIFHLTLNNRHSTRIREQRRHCEIFLIMQPRGRRPFNCDVPK
ncbi:hypothetical protein TNCV_1070621 [Trichonephila clavipes]|nr:hypothetical protein TNCV_1070621 [Trichonephila clavipes]